MLALLLGPFEPSQEAVALFCTSFGSVVTYFFTRKEGLVCPMFFGSACSLWLARSVELSQVAS